MVNFIIKVHAVTLCINPLVPSTHKSARTAKISILKKEVVIKKISYERRDYESVDENSPS